MRRDLFLTLTRSVRKRKWRYRPPAHGLFDDHGYVRQLGVVRPQRGTVFSHNTVQLLLRLLLHMRETVHGLDECEDDT